MPMPNVLPDWLLEIRTSQRRLWSNPAFAMTAIVTLTVCLGANAAIFTIVSRTLLNPLPVPNASRIFLMANQFPKTGTGQVGETSAPRNYYDRLRGVNAFSEQALFAAADRTLTSTAGATQLHGMIVTPSLFRVLGANAALGRTFTETEGETGNEQHIVLSDGLWKELFSASPAAIGRDLQLNGRPFRIVGIMPERFSFFDPAVRFWIPLAFTPAERTNPIANQWYNVGLLARDATREQAQAQVDAVNAAFLDTVPRLKQAYVAAGYHTTVEPLGDVLARGVSRTLYLLWGGAIIVLLIGAINVANLTLARTRFRTTDLATRLALGAGRWRVTAGLLIESLTVAVAGGLLGLLAGQAMLAAREPLHIDRLLRLTNVDLDLGTVAVVLALAIATGLALGLAPILYVRTLNVASVLREQGRSATAGAAGSFLRKALIIAQVALTFVSLTSAGVFLLTLMNLLSVNPGFSPDHIVTAAINLPRERYPDAPAARQFLDRALASMRTLPGVTAAAASTIVPFAGSRRTQAVVVDGYQRQSDESLVTPAWINVTPRFFETIGVTATRGREFLDQDGESDTGVAIVDETFARRFWQDGDPIGKRLFLPGVRNGLRVTPNTRWLTVVGVVPELRLERLAGAEGSAGAVYTPHSEANVGDPARSYVLAIRTSADAAGIIAAARRTLAGLDPALALHDVQTMTQRMELSLTRERLAMFLASAFAAIALFLSAVGIYGVLSYLVAERRREFGIRMVLGSTPGSLLNLVLREGLVLVGVGLVVGAAIAMSLKPVFASQIYGVQLDQPALVAGVTAVLIAVALAACLLPARRATRVDPLIVINETGKY